MSNRLYDISRELQIPQIVHQALVSSSSAPRRKKTSETGTSYTFKAIVIEFIRFHCVDQQSIVQLTPPSIKVITSLNFNYK